MTSILRDRERIVVRRLAFAFGMAVIAFALVADGAETPQAPGPDASNVPPNDPAVQANMPGCAVWTDRCVTCQLTDGKIACSNIGIACQPQAVTCLRAEPAEGNKAGN
jgi:hypothetical protein